MPVPDAGAKVLFGNLVYTLDVWLFRTPPAEAEEVLAVVTFLRNEWAISVVEPEVVSSPICYGYRPSSFDYDSLLIVLMHMEFIDLIYESRIGVSVRSFGSSRGNMSNPQWELAGPDADTVDICS
jgi:hypothetical protein